MTTTKRTEGWSACKAFYQSLRPQVARMVGLEAAEAMSVCFAGAPADSEGRERDRQPHVSAAVRLLMGEKAKTTSLKVEDRIGLLVSSIEESNPTRLYALASELRREAAPASRGASFDRPARTF